MGFFKKFTSSLLRNGMPALMRSFADALSEVKSDSGQQNEGKPWTKTDFPFPWPLGKESRVKETEKKRTPRTVEAGPDHGRGRPPFRRMPPHSPFMRRRRPVNWS